MKKAMFLAVALLVLAGSAFALPGTGYIGLFKDATHSTDPPANALCPGPYGSFHCWIWALPSARGLQAAEFRILFPASALIQTTVKNPSITAELGTLQNGISVAFGLCQMDWLWIYDLGIVILSPTPITQKIDIVPHPGTLPLPAIQFANCQLVLEPFIYLTPLYLCQDGPLGVEETNWGAIKSLF
jgi:hypothetical protein